MKAANTKLIIGCVLTLSLSRITLGQDLPKFNMLMFGMDYMTNTSSFGQLNSFKSQPSYSPGVSFFSKWGVDASITYFYLENADTSYSTPAHEVDISIGYTFDGIKNLTLSPTYTRFFNMGESNTLKSAFSDYFQLDVQYQIGMFLAGMSANYLIGENSQGYISPNFAFLFEKDEFLKRDIYLAIQPRIDLTFGKQTYISNYYLKNLPRQPKELRKFLMEEGLWEDYLSLQFQYPYLSRRQIVRRIILSNFSISEAFNLNSIIYSLPLYLMISDHWMVYANPMFYQPINKPDYIVASEKLFFSTGISYTLSW